VLTENPEPRPVAQRRFSKTDGLMLALSVAALTLPVALRLQTEAQASTPVVAVAADISPVRPIDLALGFNERRAEAAFFETMARPAPPASPVAPALQRPAPTPPEVEYRIEAPTKHAAPTMESPDAVVEDQSPISQSEPEPLLAIAELTQSQRLDFAPDTPTSDVPPVAAVEPEADPLPDAEPEEVDVAEASGPAPETSPLPSLRPAAPKIPKAVEPPVETATLDTETEAEAEVEADAPAAPAIGSIGPIVTVKPNTAAPTLDPTTLPSDVKRVTPASLSVAAASLATVGKATANGDKAPEIALVIAAAGLNTNTTRYAIEALPAGITLAFAPIKEEATALAADAKRDGHTVLVEIPLEPVNRRRDPGPLTLRVSDSPEANLERLQRALARIASLDRLEREARRTGRAVGVGTTLRGTITAVASWAKEAEKRGVRLVPIIDLAH